MSIFICFYFLHLTHTSIHFSSKMKDVIDVLAMQREKRNTLQKSITIDYTKSSDSFTVSRFIFECGMLAAMIFHHFEKLSDTLENLSSP